MPFSHLPERVVALRQEIADAVSRGGHGQDVSLVAVTKTHPADAVAAASAAGVHDVGENKVQEALTKQSECKLPVRWHLIGHLQRNKVKHLSSFHLFHAVDSARLADAINNAYQSSTSPASVLIQVNVADEESKGGYPANEVEREGERLLGMTGITVRGVMTMAPFDADEKKLREVFSGARRALQLLRAAGHDARELSMGMSQDFPVAVEEGATIVRLGTVLFGERSR